MRRQEMSYATRKVRTRRPTSFNRGSFPVTPAVRNINGHPSDSFHIPRSVSPHSCPIRKTWTRLCKVIDAALPHSCSVTHFDWL